MSKAVKSITRLQYLQLQGIAALAAYHSNMLKDLERGALEITQERGNDGTLCQPWEGSVTGEGFYGSDIDIDNVLRILRIEVVDDQEPRP